MSSAAYVGEAARAAMAQCLPMPLVSPLPADHSTEIADLARFFEGTLGFAPNSVLTMMRRPALARSFPELTRAVMSNEGRVTSEFKRLIGHVASRAAGCRYCEAHTIRAAARFGAAEGADAKRLDDVWSFRGSVLFTSAERAALEFAMAAAASPGAVDAAIGQELRTHWDDGEIVEITGVIALFGFLNRWNDAMATELEAPAAADGQRWLATRGWSAGKHQ